MIAINKSHLELFHPARLLVSAEVRYWEDAEINFETDSEDGELIPLKTGKLWCPVIVLDTGEVVGWPKGTTADVHYKVCDQGEYWLADANGRRLKWKGDYVPRILAVGENGYGDCIILNISAEGIIEGWNPPVLDMNDWASIREEHPDEKERIIEDWQNQVNEMRGTNEALRRENAELKAAIELGQINCDAAYDALRDELKATNETLVVIVEERDALLEANRQLQEERDIAIAIAEESQRTLIEYAPTIIRAEAAHGQEPHD